MKQHALLLLALAVTCACGARDAQPSTQSVPLILERTIALPDVRGRIDHLAYDSSARRLFVAELGNGTVDSIDIRTGRPVARATGLHEPQGLAWVSTRNELAVASADGTVRFYRGHQLEPGAILKIGDDADNLRIDPQSGNLVIGYGAGMLATIDPVAHRITNRLALPAHPEGFRLDDDAVYVNLPDAGGIVAGDLRFGKVTARWSTGIHRLNFPMALDREAHEIAVAFRLPARLMLMDIPSGAVRQTLGTCGDSDDLFFDARRASLYVICGSGEIDIYRSGPSGYALVAAIPTRPGARTGLFVPEEDRLYVAASAQGSDVAAILVFRPTP